jgi:hypothetical protein
MYTTQICVSLPQCIKTNCQHSGRRPASRVIKALADQRRAQQQQQQQQRLLGRAWLVATYNMWTFKALKVGRNQLGVLSPHSSFTEEHLISAILLPSGNSGDSESSCPAAACMSHQTRQACPCLTITVSINTLQCLRITTLLRVPQLPWLLINSYHTLCYPACLYTLLTAINMSQIYICHPHIYRNRNLYICICMYVRMCVCVCV